jgi:7-cyano-7-deazaguanine synthase
VARSLGIADHRVGPLGLSAIGGSALTSAGDRRCLKDRARRPRPHTDRSRRPTSPRATPSSCRWPWGWPRWWARSELHFGANALDYSGYPDCRPAFVEAFEALANVATRDAVQGGARFRVHAPLMQLTKAEIIRAARRWACDYGLTHSCYDPVGEDACGRCDSLRAAA